MPTSEPRLLMTAQTFDRNVEAEPVLVTTRDDVVDLQLDDGKVITLDRRELRATLDEAA